ncbi:M3 family oligoendopeptidase [Stenotrophomonas sp. NLF4-10]|uniref:M3 family oligoendopeptidase n=1 Tax=Stenotrophomonas sp. NLF4-10 TaxID=2918754 RepID=UPI001EFB81E3|nr:M3 family oligoendopeptidase [Stenotrophomonas sp. NLF4-10]MCG8275474.1 oligoendopeptidase F family protein [Stenotrophomonas sp. NLF4-10]
MTPRTFSLPRRRFNTAMLLLPLGAGLTSMAGAAAKALSASSTPGLNGEDVPTTWDLTDLFSTDSAWNEEAEALKELIPSLASGHAGLDNAATLLATLNRHDAITLRIMRLQVYAVLKSSEDIRVADDAQRASHSYALAAQLKEGMAWRDRAILDLGRQRVLAMIAEDGGLEVYRYPLMSIFRRASHMLDAKGEAMLASAQAVLAAPQRTRQTLLSSDIEFPEIELPKGKLRLDLEGYGTAMNTAARADRARAYDLFATTLHRYERTLGDILGAKVSGNAFLSKARGYPSSLAASLDATNTPRTVYDTLLHEVKARIPLHHRYLEVKRQLLGVDRLALWDMNAPATSLDREWSLAQARDTTLRAIAPLGPEYAGEFAANTLKRWADTLPRKGKREGGFVVGQAYAHPYVLLNYRGNFDSLSTYAHEWGHAMHSWLARAQPHPLFDFPTFIAEVPSKLNELLLLEHLSANADTRQEKLFYLDRLCEQYRGTLFIQSLFADFELAINTAADEGAPPSGPQMSEIYGKLLAEYYGPEIQMHRYSNVMWARVLHFFLDFYVFQYATCLTAATAMLDAIHRDGEPARQRYLGMLRAGNSDDAYKLIAGAGIDLATPEPYRRALDRFERAVVELESLA